MSLKIEKHTWKNLPKEIWIIDDRNDEYFQITLKQGCDVEIEFAWDHGYGGRGTERVSIPVQQLKDLLNEIDK